MIFTIWVQIILNYWVKVHYYPGHSENEAYSNDSELIWGKFPAFEGTIIVDECEVVVISIGIVELADGLARFHVEVAQEIVF